ncbi:hypothetical protein S7711_10993 [Stachybotrys chartarum IBT 7711]|uniref:Uncharacterized protein n=1 Tax=Stachybotrys chartarum (strain CBS 109288 / IBT 7711) TaxID=1280523 RepID=A0A084AKP7_STACB|nr:hypothetical protein S7711_10993 [Stachybotrys chartarum IBT 7711]KFA51551.1 hypothetical protein S40293_11067 [Stachybotrys chartarum IBT 40293]KFA75402.1 hypothetical protein S40288_10677 [Stachybotrys chartarum IBT 40288]
MPSHRFQKFKARLLKRSKPARNTAHAAYFNECTGCGSILFTKQPVVIKDCGYSAERQLVHWEGPRVSVETMDEPDDAGCGLGAVFDKVKAWYLALKRD